MVRKRKLLSGATWIVLYAAAAIGAEAGEGDPQGGGQEQVLAPKRPRLVALPEQSPPGEAPRIPPPRPFRVDPGITRSQVPAGDAPANDPPQQAPPSRGVPEDTTIPDLTVPAESRGLGGGSPTTVEAEAEAATESEAPTTLLMRALDMRDSPVKIYGWLQNSFTGNANGFGNGKNFGVTPNFKADQWMGNQYYLVVENPLEQNDKVNFGFRIDNMFGNDWQFNYMQGLFNGAFPPGQFAGYDLSQLYGEVHLPILTEGGLDVKGGLWYALAGYEQVPAIARPLLSVPYMFNYGQPFRHVGVLTTLHLTPQLNLFNAAINGWDRWINENYIWGYTGGFNWTSKDTKTNVAFTCVWGPNQFPHYLAGNQGIYPTGYINIPSAALRPNPRYATNERTLFTTVVTHKWGESGKLTQVIETDQAWEQNVPGLANNGLTTASRNAEWYSFGNWFLYNVTPKITGVWRSEVFWDPTGDRTGYRDTYYEMTLGGIIKPKDYLWIRPELRYDWAQFGTPYSNQTRGSQLTLAFDVILLF